MVIICFPDGRDWFNPNWVYRQLSADVAATYPDDADLQRIFLHGQYNHGLLLDRLKPEEASKIMEVLKTVAQAALDGKTPGWLSEHPEDLDGQRMYLESMSELLEAMRPDHQSA